MSHCKPGRVLTRRQALVATGGLVMASFAAGVSEALADAESTRQAMATLIGSEAPKAGRIKLKIPDLAEDGHTVPLSFAVESPMIPTDYVKAVHIFAEGNPRPNVASFYFTVHSGKAQVSTRIRLAKAQNVIVVAQMNDGSAYMTQQQVDVTIGGCGGHQV